MTSVGQFMISVDLLMTRVDLLMTRVDLLMTQDKAPMILLLCRTDHQPLINRNHEMIMNHLTLEQSTLHCMNQLMPMINMITVPPMIFLRCS